MRSARPRRGKRTKNEPAAHARTPARVYRAGPRVRSGGRLGGGVIFVSGPARVEDTHEDEHSRRETCTPVYVRVAYTEKITIIVINVFPFGPRPEYWPFTNAITKIFVIGQGFLDRFLGWLGGWGGKDDLKNRLYSRSVYSCEKITQFELYRLPYKHDNYLLINIFQLKFFRFFNK